MHTIKRWGFIDTMHRASTLLKRSSISIPCLTTILSLIVQQYQLNHVPPDSSYSLFLAHLYIYICISVYPNEPIRSFPSSKRPSKSSGEFQRILSSKFFLEIARKNSSLSFLRCVVSSMRIHYITRHITYTNGVNPLYTKWKMAMVNVSVGNLSW